MKSPAEGNGNSNGMGSDGPKTRERRADCPPAIVTEAKVVWAALVKTLRTAASDAPTAALYGPADNPFAPLVTLYRYDSSCDVLTLVSALVIGAVYHELKPDYAAEIRRGVMHFGANCVFFAGDWWISPGGFPGRPSQAPDRRECLILLIELQNGDVWQACEKYCRLGSRVFIRDAMPELELTPKIAGLFSGWWSPTPTPENN